MYNGVINIYKEAGYTSHDVVAKMRGILKQRKIGHTGTLDPDATGVLLVCLGNATKLCDILADRRKAYEAVIRFGLTTDTQDASGRIISTSNIIPTEEEIGEAVRSFVGGYMQIPPMYSALKVNGKKLVDLAREGIEVERKARPIEISEISLSDLNFPTARLQVSCGKGTYIRTLCHDIGQKLGCGAVMESLERTMVSGFYTDSALTLGELERLRDAGELEKHILSPDSFFLDCIRARVKEEALRFAYNGNKLTASMLDFAVDGAKERIRVYDPMERFLGIYELQSDKTYKPFKVFYTEQNQK